MTPLKKLSRGLLVKKRKFFGAFSFFGGRVAAPQKNSKPPKDF